MVHFLCLIRFLPGTRTHAASACRRILAMLFWLPQMSSFSAVWKKRYCIEGATKENNDEQMTCLSQHSQNSVIGQDNSNHLAIT